MKILVTGAAGFLGSVLVRLLLGKGYAVRALDNFYFEIDSLEGVRDNPNLEVITADTRRVNPGVLDGVSVVIDLAAIGQPDPRGLVDLALYHDINCLAPIRVATLSKLRGVKKYIFASTCSVYGVQEDIVNENSKLNPMDRYAETKSIVEKSVLPLNDDKFSVTILRLATLYGYSRKMRFDLLLNGMTLSAFRDNRIMILGDGQQRRPIVHVRDIANAITEVVEEEGNRTKGEIFNVGSNHQNYKVCEVAELVESVFKGCRSEFYGDPDRRSYNVNFDKIANVLGYETEHSPIHGVQEIREALENGSLKPMDNHWVINWWARIGRGQNLWQK